MNKIIHHKAYSIIKTLMASITLHIFFCATSYALWEALRMASFSKGKTTERAFLTASVEFRPLGTKETITVSADIKEESLYPSSPNYARQNHSHQKNIATDSQDTKDSIMPNIIPHPDNKDPIYPEEARQDGLEATCIVKLLICPNGTIHSVKIMSTSQSCPACFGKAAQKTLSAWRFSPHKSAYTERIVPIEFKLN